jgi:hypothetical protein
MADVTFRRATFVGHDTKEATGRFTGVHHQQFKVAAGGKSLAELPFVDGRDGKTQVGSHLFQWYVVPLPPVTESHGKTGAHIVIRLQFRFFGHRNMLAKFPSGSKRLTA